MGGDWWGEMNCGLRLPGVAALPSPLRATPGGAELRRGCLPRCHPSGMPCLHRGAALCPEGASFYTGFWQRPLLTGCAGKSREGQPSLLLAHQGRTSNSRTGGPQTVAR